MARGLWFVLGWLALTLGAIGIVLPLLPTTPFLLVAVFAFARSSPALHDWLVHHPRFGPLIQDWRDHGAINRRAKMFASVMMAGVLGLSIAMGLALWVIGVQAACLACVALFIWTRPDGPDDQILG